MDSPTNINRQQARTAEQERSDAEALLVKKWFEFLRTKVYHGLAVDQVLQAIVRSTT